MYQKHEHVSIFISAFAFRSRANRNKLFLNLCTSTTFCHTNLALQQKFHLYIRKNRKKNIEMIYGSFAMKNKIRQNFEGAICAAFLDIIKITEESRNKSH